jgi:hypothetical protein
MYIWYSYEYEERVITVSHKKPYKLLIDKDLKKKYLLETTGISIYTRNKPTVSKHVNVDVPVFASA